MELGLVEHGENVFLDDFGSNFGRYHFQQFIVFNLLRFQYLLNTFLRTLFLFLRNMELVKTAALAERDSRIKLPLVFLSMDRQSALIVWIIHEFIFLVDELHLLLLVVNSFGPLLFLSRPFDVQS